MPNLQYIIELIKRGDGANQAATELRRYEAETRRATTATRAFEVQAARSSLSFGELNRIFRLLGISLGTFSLGAAVRSSINAFLEHERAIAKNTGTANKLVSDFDQLNRAIGELNQSLGGFLLESGNPVIKWGTEMIETFNDLHRSGMSLVTLFSSFTLGGGLVNFLRKDELVKDLKNVPRDSTLAKLAEEAEAAKLEARLMLQTKGVAARTRTDPPGLKGDIEQVQSKARQARREARATGDEIEAVIKNLTTLDATRIDTLLFAKQQLLDTTLRNIDIEAAAEIKRLEDHKAAQDKIRRGVMTTGEIIDQVATQGSQAFASGFASAFTDFISGAKSAEEAFKGFAATFLKMVAEMIIQQLILNALRSAFPSVFHAASGGVYVGDVNTGRSVPMTAAYGGLFPALAGMKKMAAGGVEGAIPLSGPTYFPKFNVLAGERGFEIGAFLAQPRYRSVGGLDYVEGKAGANRLALADADQLKATVSGGGGGRTDIYVHLDPGLTAEITSRASNVAVSQVVRGLQTDSTISQSVKRLIS